LSRSPAIATASSMSRRIIAKSNANRKGTYAYTTGFAVR
jgi:hypothetical protein